MGAGKTGLEGFKNTQGGQRNQENIEKVGTGRFIDDTGEKISSHELQVANELAAQGKTVIRLPRETKIEGVGTPDFRVDGVRTEIKQLRNPSTNTGSKRIKEGFEQNAEKVIVDARGTGLTRQEAQVIIARAKGKYPTGTLPGMVEVWIDGELVSYP